MPAPVITTDRADRITQTTARLRGLESSFDSDTRGFLWSTDPGVGSASYVEGIFGLGSPAPFTATVEGLPAGTVIYWVAVGENGFGQGFGEVKSFTTLREIPPHRMPPETPPLAKVLCTGQCTCTGEPLSRETFG